MTADEINELVGRQLLNYDDGVAFHLDDGWLLEGIVTGFIRSGSDVLIVTLSPADGDVGDEAIHVPVSSIRAVQNLGRITFNE